MCLLWLPICGLFGCYTEVVNVDEPLNVGVHWLVIGVEVVEPAHYLEVGHSVVVASDLGADDDVSLN